jgi:hypothetical protein
VIGRVSLSHTLAREKLLAPWMDHVPAVLTADPAPVLPGDWLISGTIDFPREILFRDLDVGAIVELRGVLYIGIPGVVVRNEVY